MYLVCRLLLDTSTTTIYTLSLHDALPISPASAGNPFSKWAGTGNRSSKLLEPILLRKRKERIQHKPAETVIRPREPQPYEMMRAGHDFVVKVGIQEAFEAR